MDDFSQAITPEMWCFSLNSTKMATDTKIIELLNAAVRDELTAIHQYLYLHFHCEDQRLNWAAAMYKKAAVEQMHVREPDTINPKVPLGHLLK